MSIKSSIGWADKTLNLNLGLDKQWISLLRSIKRAAKILNIDLTEKDIPEYGEWYSAVKLHSYLWSMVKRQKRIRKEY
jgi:hypothetical protein